jgi:hypothetical protein
MTMAESHYARIEGLAMEAAPHLALEVMDATDIAYFLTALYHHWAETRRDRDENNDRMVEEAMKPLMELRSITDAARTVVKFEKELERLGFDPPQ